MTSSRSSKNPATLRHTEGSLPKATRLDGCEAEHGLPGAARTQHGVQGGEGWQAGTAAEVKGRLKLHPLVSPGSWNPGSGPRPLGPSLPSSSDLTELPGEARGGGLRKSPTQTEPTHPNPTSEVKNEQIPRDTGAVLGQVRGVGCPGSREATDSAQECAPPKPPRAKATVPPPGHPGRGAAGPAEVARLHAGPTPG